MGKDEVLTAGLTHEARVLAIICHILTHGLPHHLKRWGRSRKVYTAELRVLECNLTDLRSITMKHIDDTRWHSGFFKNLDDNIR